MKPKVARTQRRFCLLPTLIATATGTLYKHVQNKKIITKIPLNRELWCCQTLTLTISTNKNFDLTCFQVFNNFLQNVLFSCNFHYLNGKAQRISYGSSVTYTEMEIKIRTSVFRAHNNY